MPASFNTRNCRFFSPHVLFSKSDFCLKKKTFASAFCALFKEHKQEKYFIVHLGTAARSRERKTCHFATQY